MQWPPNIAFIMRITSDLIKRKLSRDSLSLKELKLNEKSVVLIRKALLEMRLCSMSCE